MYSNNFDFSFVDHMIDTALSEDIGKGDITTDSIIPGTAAATAQIIVKSDGIIAGLPVAGKVFGKLDPGINWNPFFDDGFSVSRNTVVAEVTGSYRAILTGERTALNFLQRVSGIATYTSLFVNELTGLKTKILDTRKTAPGLRLLDKYAVKMGGGINHRVGLYDMIMIKDNHIKAAGSITDAVRQVKDAHVSGIKIEVETGNLDQVNEALAAGADIIMLDNMNTLEMQQAVKFIDGKCMVEASGSVNLFNVREIAETGVDFISVGALTHSVRALDISLNIP